MLTQLPSDVLLAIAAHLPVDDEARLACVSPILTPQLRGHLAQRREAVRAAAIGVARVALLLDDHRLLSMRMASDHEAAWRRAGVVPEETKWTRCEDGSFICDDGAGSFVRMDLPRDRSMLVSRWSAVVDGMECTFVVSRGFVSLLFDGRRAFDIIGGRPRAVRHRVPPPLEDDILEDARRDDGNAAWVQAMLRLTWYEDALKRAEEASAVRSSYAKRLVSRAVLHVFSSLPGGVYTRFSRDVDLARALDALDALPDL